MSAAPCVLLLVPSMHGMGGTERVVHELAALLAESGGTVHQVSFDPPGTVRHYESATPLHALGPLPRLALPLRPVTYARAARRLRALERALGVDVTISNLWGADLVSAFAGASGPGPARVALAHINVRDNPDNRTMMRFLPLVAAIYRRFDHVVAVSAPLAGELEELYALAAGRITSIHNFVRIPDGGPPPWPQDDGVARVVWCGRMAPVKNVEGLLHAWARYRAGAEPGRQLVLVGDGPARADLERLAGLLGLRAGTDPSDTAASVVFVGSVAHSAPYLAAARGLVLSSHAEGAPMVVLEALTLGVPVLASDCPAGGVRAQLTDVPAASSGCIEDTGCGALLPIPSANDAAALDAWARAFALLFDGESPGATAATWRRGASARGARFGRARASDLWNDLLRVVRDARPSSAEPR